MEIHEACMKGIEVANKKANCHRLTVDNNTCTLGIIFSRLKDNFKERLLKKIFWEIHVLIKIYSCPQKDNYKITY